MSDTPRTDAMEYYFSNHDTCAGESIYTVIGDNDVTWAKGFEGYSTPSDFSRQLERELAEVTKQRDELLEALDKLLDRSYQFTDEGPLLEGWKSDEFRAEIEKAESAIAKTKGGAQ